MNELKKKCWREKVTAEVTMSHLLQFVQETGTHMTEAEVAQFLNENGRAQIVWMHMMQAAEDYIKSSLKNHVTENQVRVMPVGHRPVVQTTMVH